MIEIIEIIEIKQANRNSCKSKCRAANGKVIDWHSRYLVDEIHTMNCNMPGLLSHKSPSMTKSFLVRSLSSSDPECGFPRDPYYGIHSDPQ